MKKQLLISAILVLVLFFNVSKSYAQCDDALHPVAGKSYPYSLTVNPTGGTFNWFVTSDPHIATAAPILSGSAGGDILIAGTGYNLPGSTSASIDITWTSKAVANAQATPTPTKYYLVVKYTTDCTNNIRPWRITPINFFQIAVENVNSAGSTYADICRVPFVDAVIGADDKVTYDYGENAFYLKVTANNFTGSWTPKVNIAALQAPLTAPQTIKSIEWSLNTTFTGASNFDLATGVATMVVPDKDADNVTSGTDEFVYIKVVLTDGKFEGTASQSLAFNLSATDVAGNPDVDVVVGTPCIITAGINNVIQVIKARPSMTNPNPAPFLITN
jgi:hypothetical protein